MKKALLTFSCYIMALSFCLAQNNTVWHGKKSAVVLTYDDAIPQQLDNAVPVLDSLNLKATFLFNRLLCKRQVE